MNWITRDGKIIFIARAVRSPGFGFTRIILGIYFVTLGSIRSPPVS
jgi:hypothetical protein